MCDKVQFDLNGEIEKRIYKSCFAQAMAVNLQNKQPKSLNYQQFESRNRDVSDNNGKESRKDIFTTRSPSTEIQEIIRLRKNSRSISDDTRRYSCGNINSIRRSSLCSSRVTQIPVENICNQSKVETLQWHLKENSRSISDDTRRYSCGNINSIRRSSICSSRVTQSPVENICNQSKVEMLQWQLKEINKSREMYRAVMKQVVTYLEKAHHSLELLGSRMNRRTSAVHRSRSEHQMDNSCGLDDTNMSQSTNTSPNRTLDEHQMRDLQWQQSKPEEASPEEIPPDKLASEAYRLWRTVQSLLGTQEPDLASVYSGDRGDDDFLAQLAKEFPPQPEGKPQRATSFSLSSKVIAPDAKISMAFNRKLSLQLGDSRRISKVFRNMDSARCSVAGSDSESLCGRKTKREKSNSPASGSVSSVEDESGFSSMTSFQEVGLPLVNSTMTEEVSTKNALLRSMLHNNGDHSSLNFSIDNQDSLSETIVPEENDEKRECNVDEIRLWQKPTPTSSSNSPINRSTPQHTRWYSSPVDEPGINRSVKVLWV